VRSGGLALKSDPPFVRFCMLDLVSVSAPAPRGNFGSFVEKKNHPPDPSWDTTDSPFPKIPSSSFSVAVGQTGCANDRHWIGRRAALSEKLTTIVGVLGIVRTPFPDLRRQRVAMIGSQQPGQPSMYASLLYGERNRCLIC